jgi:hypothetical protein
MPKSEIVDASDLGLPPGSWPTTLGDGYWFKSRSEIRNGELVYVEYVHEDRKMVVYND